MIEEEKAQTYVELIQKCLTQIKDGNHPYVSSQLNLDDRWSQADWQICSLLKHLIPVLPESLREQVQACYDLREQVWSTEYMNAYYEAQRQAQQKTSPESLATAG